MLFKTGEKAPVTGSYKWERYVDGTKTPEPTQQEKIIILSKGEEFPPIRSCNKSAYWSHYN